MKQWQETAQICSRLTALTAAGERAALATVVAIKGSAYRRPGAKLLIEADGSMLGGVSGGCLEADVRETGLAVLKDGEPRLRHYDTSTDADVLWGLGLGCDGSIDVFVQATSPTDTAAALAQVGSLLQGDMPFAIATVVGGDVPTGGALVYGADARVSGGTGSSDLDRQMIATAAKRLAARSSALERLGAADVFTEVMTPPAKLVVFGAGDDARPLATLASAVGFRVSVVDHRPAYLTASRFPEVSRLIAARYDEAEAVPLGAETYAVVMTHALEHDRGWATQLASSGIAYLGLLGPRARTEGILEEIDEQHRARVYGPVGLDVGADGPEQVALSIVAELLAVHAGRDPRHLRDRSGVIHAL